MIAIDTSTFIAILLDEPERLSFNRCIADHQPAFTSAVSLQEAGMIMRSRKGETGVKDLYALLTALHVEVVAYDEAQAHVAIEAFGRYGKGLGTVAKLNMGDCASYALAKSFDVPLLYKGHDFAATDVTAAV
jgi:ribonuclease VapC